MKSNRIGVRPVIIASSVLAVIGVAVWFIMFVVGVYRHASIEAMLELVVSNPRSGETAVHQAVERGQLQILNELIKSGAALNVDSPRLGTPLFYASAYGKDEIVGALLAGGADPNLGSMQTRSHSNIQYPLLMASASARAAVIDELVKSGARVSQLTNERQSALHVLAISSRNELAENRISAAKTLVRLGVPLNVVDVDGRTALDWSEIGAQDEVTGYLRSVGARRAAELPVKE